MDFTFNLPRGSISNILRVKIRDLSDNNGAGKTGLAFNTANLIISTAVDNEAAATAYTVAGSLLETIAALGTYAAPTATKCRFKEFDATNHPGLYELQLADARFAVAGSNRLAICISGAADAEQTDITVNLLDDPVVLARGTIATLASQTSFTLSVGSADNSAYVGCTIVVQNATTGVQRCVGIISAYTGSTRTVTLAASPGIFTMAVGDKFVVLAKQAPTLSGQTLSLNGPTLGPSTGTISF